MRPSLQTRHRNPAVTRLLFLLQLCLLVVVVSGQSTEPTTPTPETSTLWWGDDCHDDDNPCPTGFDCMRSPIRRRCFPVTCAVQAVLSAVDQTGFDLEGYGRDLQEKAGLKNARDMFTLLPDRHMNLWRENSIVDRVIDVVRQNQPPLKLMEESFNECTQLERRRLQHEERNRSRNLQTDNFGQTLYGGASWALGFLGVYTGDIFFGQVCRQCKLLPTRRTRFGYVIFSTASHYLFSPHILGTTGLCRCSGERCTVELFWCRVGKYN